MLLRERHELERKLAEIEDRERSGRNADQELVNRLRRDLKKTKILLHDAQLMLQQTKMDAPNKAMLRQLRNQVSVLASRLLDNLRLRVFKCHVCTVGRCRMR